MAWTIVNETPEPMPEELPKTLADAPCEQVYLTHNRNIAWRSRHHPERVMILMSDGYVAVSSNGPEGHAPVKHLGPAPKIRWDEDGNKETV